MFRRIAVVVFLFAAGCVCDQKQFRLPDFQHPGTLQEQQQRAKQFDPFSRTGIAPNITGDRPAGVVPVPIDQQYLKK